MVSGAEWGSDMTETNQPRARLAGETVICMAPDPWEGLWRNRHQIMTRLARHNTVLYVEPRLYYPETLRRLGLAGSSQQIFASRWPGITSTGCGSTTIRTTRRCRAGVPAAR